MATKVEAPDGTIVEFPEGTDKETIKRVMREQFGGPDTPRNDSSARFLNEGIAEGLGSPVDLANTALNAVGLGTDRPIGGRKSVEQGMNYLGRTAAPALLGTEPQRLTPRRNETPDNMGEAALRGIGLAAGGALPFAGGASAVASRGAGAAQRIGQNISQQFTQTPLRTAGTEGLLGATAGVGGQAAVERTGDESARALGEVAGGLAPGAAVGTAKVTPTALGGRFLYRNMVRPFTPSQGPGRAGERLRSLEQRPGPATRQGRAERDMRPGQATANDVSRPTESDLSPAQRSGQPRFFELEQTRRQQDPSFDELIAEQQARASGQLRQSAREIGGDVNVQQTREAINQQIDESVDRINQRLRQLNPRQREAEQSRIVRNELNEALKRGRQQEDRVWNRVPRDIEQPSENTRDTFEDLLRSRDEDVEDPRNIPGYLRTVIGRLDKEGNFRPGKIGEQASVDRLQKLRSRVLADAREERAKDAPNWQRVRVLDDVADSLLADMGARVDEVEGEAGEALRQALDYSRTLNERFSQGVVGRLLGKDRTGGQTVPPEATLETSVGQRGGRGLANTRQILDAVQDAPEETRQQIEDYMRSRFQQKAVQNEELKPERARQFLDENQEVLNEFAGLRRQIEQAAEGQASIDDFRRSDVQRFLSSREGEEINSILKAQSPGRAARQVVQGARQSGGQQAVEGIKSGLRRYIVKKSEMPSFDDKGQFAISGKRMRQQLQDKRLRPVINAVLSDTEKTKIGRLAREFEMLERAQQARPRREGLVGDTTNQLLTTPARIFGAQLGGRLGASSAGGSLQTAQIFSGRARDLMMKLTRDRAEELLARSLEPGNDELFKALLTDMRTEAGRRRANNRLNAWLAGPGSDLIGGDDEQDKPLKIDIP